MTPLPLADHQKKAAELSEKLKCEIIPLVYNVAPDDQVIGFLREPSYDERAFAFEQTLAGTAMSGAEAIFFKCIIKDESDERLLTDDKLKFSAVAECVKFVKGYDNQLKKK